jgi:purine catabolism regulator
MVSLVPRANEPPYYGRVPSREHDPGQGMLPGVRDLLELPVMSAAAPEVAAGAEWLERPIRWVREDPGTVDRELSLSGELILVPARSLLDCEPDLAKYVRTLRTADVAAIAVQLDEQLPKLPRALVRACTEHRLPLIGLHRKLGFAQACDALRLYIVRTQYAALTASYEAHARFTRLCVEGGSPEQILEELTRTSGFPAVFENMMHQVLAFSSSGYSVDRLLDKWETRSRAVLSSPGPAGPEGWLSVPVVAREQTWGRVVLLPGGRRAPNDLVTLEMAATSLALNRLLEGNRVSMERETHRGILTDVISRRYSSLREIESRAAAIGVPVRDRQLVALVLDFSRLPRAEADRSEQDADLVAKYLRGLGIPSLVGQSGEQRLAVLLSLPPGEDRRPQLEKLARILSARQPEWIFPMVVLSAGSTVGSLRDFQRSFLEAEQVAEAVDVDDESKPYFELPDVQLRGLLRVLSKDARLQAFVERTLGPILEYDARHQTALVDTLRTYLAAGGNKSLAAGKAHLSRQTFYARLTTIQHILGVDLESAEIRTTLHTAVMALESQRGTGTNR